MIKFSNAFNVCKLEQGEPMKKKLAVGLSLLGMLAFIGGAFTCFSQDTKKETAQNSVFISEKKQEKDTSVENTTSEKTKPSSSQAEVEEKQPLSKDDKKEKEVQAFNTAVLAQDYYLEKVENGKLSYEKATEEGLKRLEKQVGDKNLSHYQVLHDGQMISVLTGNEEGTDA